MSRDCPCVCDVQHRDDGYGLVVESRWVRKRDLVTVSCRVESDGEKRVICHARGDGEKRVVCHARDDC
jgi:hypothetical protein